jgi:Cytidylyltransferase-like
MLDSVYRGDLPWVRHDPDGTYRLDVPAPRLVLPGSFNPLHPGHTKLAELAADRFGEPVAFELSIANADKPELPLSEVLRRLEQFRGRAPVYVTRARTFREKAALFPGCVFVVGADTAVRVIDSRFYGSDLGAVLRALDSIRTARCRFLVGGRVDADGRFVEAGGIAVPDAYRDLFLGLPEREFREDISSTELRRKGLG